MSHLVHLLKLFYFAVNFFNLIEINRALENYSEEFGLKEGLNLKLLSFMSCDILCKIQSGFLCRILSNRRCCGCGVVSNVKLTRCRAGLQLSVLSAAPVAAVVPGGGWQPLCPCRLWGSPGTGARAGRLTMRLGTCSSRWSGDVPAGLAPCHLGRQLAQK